MSVVKKHLNFKLGLVSLGPVSGTEVGALRVVEKALSKQDV